MLAGKTAIVTGSTSGIGLGIAKALAGQNAHVMLNGFGERGAIDKLRKELADENGVTVAYSAADVSKPAEIRAMIEAAQKELGSVDIVVNNAGIQHVALVEEFPDDKWDAILAINLSAAFHAIKAAVPGMKRRGWGRIINIASAHGLVASAEKAGYVTAKHGLVGLTKVVAIETANSGITCNAICPGWVLTPLVQKQVEAKATESRVPVEKAKQDLVREKQPMLRFTEPHQIGALVVFLCGEDADTITGAALSIDGGWVAQ
jgi:3-hydroxybutyrate dehydrogenase